MVALSTNYFAMPVVLYLKYPLNCWQQKGLLDDEEGLVAEAGDSHATQHPQSLLNATPSKQN